MKWSEKVMPQSNLTLSEKIMEKIDIKMLNLRIIGSATPFRKKYPMLLNVLARSKRGFNDWDFFMTVASAGTYLINIKVAQDNIDKEQLADAMSQLYELDKQMPDGLNNFLDFMTKKHNEDLDKRALVGFWVLLNIGGEAPNFEETKKLAPAIGSYLYNIISSEY